MASGMPGAVMSETIGRLSDDLGQEILHIAVTTAGDLIIETSDDESTIPISDLADRHGPDARKFCLAPLIWAWLRRYATPEHRRDQIAPESLRHARVTQASLPMAPGDGLPRLGRQEGHQASLPGMEPPTATVVPALPLPVAMEHTAGPGGHIASRLWFGFQMALPLDLRTSSDVRMKFTLRDIRDWLWPHGWRRGVHLPMLQKGLRDLYQLGIVYDRAEWLLVRPVTLPTGDTRLDDILLVDVTALPGSDRGPMVDTVRLWQLGVQSAVAWRAWIRLAYLWDDAKRRNGGHRIHAARPEVRRGQDGVILDARGQPVLTKGGLPVKNWGDRRAIPTGRLERHSQADRVPVLDTDDLAHLGYNDLLVPAETLRERAAETRRWLRKMSDMGAVVLEWDGGAVRVLEPFRDQ